MQSSGGLDTKTRQIFPRSLNRSRHQPPESRKILFSVFTINETHFEVRRRCPYEEAGPARFFSHHRTAGERQLERDSAARKNLESISHTAARHHFHYTHFFLLFFRSPTEHHEIHACQFFPAHPCVQTCASVTNGCALS